MKLTIFGATGGIGAEAERRMAHLAGGRGARDADGLGRSDTIRQGIGIADGEEWRVGQPHCDPALDHDGRGPATLQSA